MKFSTAAIAFAISSMTTMSSVTAFQSPVMPMKQSSASMTKLDMSNNNQNSFWGMAVSAWAGLTIAAQVATAAPPQQQYEQGNVIWKETPSVITSALGSGVETMDFSMPSYDQETKTGIKPKVGADVPSFNPFGDFEPKIVEGGDNSEAKRAEAEAKKAEERAAREAARAEAEAKKAEEKAARDAAKAEAEAKRAEEKAARDAAKAESEAKKAEEKAAAKENESSSSASSNSVDFTMPSIDIPEFKAPDIKMPDVSIPDIKVPDIKIPDFKKPDITIPDFKASMADIKAPTITVPDFKMDIPKVDMPKMPAFSVPSFGGGSSEVLLEPQEVRDDRAREARQVFLEADKEAKAAEAAAREVRKAANEKKNLAKAAKDEACKTRPGGKFLCLRNPFTSGY